jgi:hypothetical protein
MDIRNPTPYGWLIFIVLVVTAVLLILAGI